MNISLTHTVAVYIAKIVVIQSGNRMLYTLACSTCWCTGWPVIATRQTCRCSSICNQCSPPSGSLSSSWKKVWYWPHYRRHSIQGLTYQHLADPLRPWRARITRIAAWCSSSSRSLLLRRAIRCCWIAFKTWCASNKLWWNSEGCW